MEATTFFGASGLVFRGLEELFHLYEGLSNPMLQGLGADDSTDCEGIVFGINDASLYKIPRVPRAYER